MKKKIKVFLVVGLLISFIVTSNYYSYVYILLADGGISKSYKFETFDGKHYFITIPGKGANIATLERRFEGFIDKNPEYKGTQLYRTFKRNPLKYWRWYEFATHPRYKYPYKKAGGALTSPCK